jgi:putative lipase involved disintegration of autophagic bodies
MRKHYNKVIIILLILIISYQFVPDYKIVNSRIMMSDNKRDVEINAVVYKFWNTDKIAKKIAAEHQRINPKPTFMKINIHICRTFVIKGYEPYLVVRINMNYSPES